jgi:uncharacterized protein
MNYFKFILYTLVFIGFSYSRAGSYEDFFQALDRDESKVVENLLRSGFDPNTPGPSGAPPLMAAIRLKAVKSAIVLASWPSTQVDQRNADDETPLMMAAFNNLMPVTHLLIERQADVNKTGWTPLHYAATNGHLEMILKLLQHHAYIDAPSPNGTTPLMMAAHYGNPKAVQLLLEEGADPRIKNHLGLSALDFAAKGPHAVEASALIQSFLNRLSHQNPGPR